MFTINAKSQTQKNNNYRKVVHTTPEVQLVYMSLKAGEDIPLETHDGTQVLNIIDGRGLVQSGNTKKILQPGIVVIIPPHTDHYVKNTSSNSELKLWSIYTPPEHHKGQIDKRQPDESDENY